ncbi:hypothetical protein CBS147333_9957 [Penicillium roqueforti]|nr:hypothetical protein CBS147333_9957 [Penicillium roqueforti]KAI3189197.1 hypothetical protein CBS147311_9897 [Penicillium roqueforti]KAI3261373.1 hypothetical protein CBS147308_9776 [Penicillium roqueforti]KAI3278003.1 hypothetical protein DTO003C3_9892 [Penicillium roqueforti]
MQPIKLHATILDLPTEILWVIADTLRGHEISALARTSRILYPKLRLALIKYNVRHQNSSALHWAAKSNSTDFAKTLLSYRANVNTLVDDCSPLMTAVRYGSKSTVKPFLKNSKTIINLRNAAGRSTLWYSVENGSYSIVKKLLQHPGIEIDLLDYQGQTALWLAIFQKKEKLVCLLLSKGADPHTMDLDGVSPWMAAFSRAPMLDVLLEHFDTLRPESKSKFTVAIQKRFMVPQAKETLACCESCSAAEETSMQWTAKEEQPCILQRVMGTERLPSYYSTKNPLIWLRWIKQTARRSMQLQWVDISQW